MTRSDHMEPAVAASLAAIRETMRDAPTHPRTARKESRSTDDVVATLLDVLHSSESDTARIAAAKILLEKLAPKEDDETQKRQAEERDAALAEARGLLAEFAALRFAGVCEPGAVDQGIATEPDHAAG